MRNAVIAAVAFVLFIVLVEWQRRSTLFPKSYDAKVSTSTTTAHRSRPSATRRAPSESESEAEESPLVVSDDGGAGTAKPGEPAPSAEPPSPEQEEAARKKAEAVMDRIEQLLEHEDREEPWATDTERWITTRFGTGAGTQLERVQCKRTLCAVVALHDAKPKVQSWVSRMSTAARGLRAMTMPTELEDGKTRTRTFLFKEGQSAVR